MRESRTRLRTWLGAALTVLALPLVTFAGDDTTASQHEEVVVYVDPGRLDVKHLRKLYGNAKWLDRHVSAVHWKKLAGPGGKRFSAIVLKVPSSARADAWLDRLSRLRGVEFTHLHTRLDPEGQPIDMPPLWGPPEWDETTARAQDAFGDLNAAAASAYATGAGVRVAVLDGGFDTTHDYLAGVLTSDSVDVIDGDSDPHDVGNGIDDDGDGHIDLAVGHGTFLSGLIHLCAEDAAIHAVRILDDEGQGTDLHLALGLSEAIFAGDDVINLSLRAPALSQWTKDTIQLAISEDIVIVSAAGNDPSGPFDHPYLRQRSLTVGAATDTGTIATWSPTYSWVDVFAPGGSPVIGPLGGPHADSWGTWCGSSFSTAFASAAAALVREADPSLDQLQVRHRIADEGPAVLGDPQSPARGVVDLLDAVDDL